MWCRIRILTCRVSNKMPVVRAMALATHRPGPGLGPQRNGDAQLSHYVPGINQYVRARHSIIAKRYFRDPVLP